VNQAPQFFKRRYQVQLNEFLSTSQLVAVAILNLTSDLFKSRALHFRSFWFGCGGIFAVLSKAASDSNRYDACCRDVPHNDGTLWIDTLRGVV